MLCDIILLNFLKGAEHYKARKFEEVSVGLGPLWGWGQAGVTSVGAGSGHTRECGAGWGAWGTQAVPLRPPGCPGYGAGTNPVPIPCPTGARGSRARAPRQPHSMSPQGTGGLQSRQAVHRLGHLLPRPLALGTVGQPPACPLLWGSPPPALSWGAPLAPPGLAPPFPH